MKYEDLGDAKSLSFRLELQLARLKSLTDNLPKSITVSFEGEAKPFTVNSRSVGDPASDGDDMNLEFLQAAVAAIRTGIDAEIDGIEDQLLAIDVVLTKKNPPKGLEAKK